MIKNTTYSIPVKLLFRFSFPPPGCVCGSGQLTKRIKNGGEKKAIKPFKWSRPRTGWLREKKALAQLSAYIGRFECRRDKGKAQSLQAKVERPKTLATGLWPLTERQLGGMVGGQAGQHCRLFSRLRNALFSAVKKPRAAPCCAKRRQKIAGKAWLHWRRPAIGVYHVSIHHRAANICCLLALRNTPDVGVVG